MPPTADGQVETLSPKEIEQLPDDPDELALAIEALAGVGAEIRVNGFEGGALPPKNQIQVVRIRKDPFSTDSMGAGQVRVEIITRPGGSSWTHEVSAGYRDQSIDARPPFSPRPAGGADTTPQLELQWPGREGAVVDRPVACRCATPTMPARSSRQARRPTFPALVNAERERFEGEVRVEHALNVDADAAWRVPALGLDGRQPRRRRVRVARARLQRGHRPATSRGSRRSARLAGTSSTSSASSTSTCGAASTRSATPSG